MPRLLGFLILLFQIAPAAEIPANLLQKLEQARSLYREGRLTKASEAFQSILQDHPGFLDARLDLAATLREAGRIPEAISALEAAKSQAPDRADVMNELAWLRFHTGNLGGARASFEESLRADPKNAGAFLGMGVALLAEERAGEAIGYLKKLQARRPNFAPSYYFVGQALTALGKATEAIKSYLTAARKDFAFVEARLPLADVYLAEGDIDSAWAEYTRVVNLYDGHARADKLRRQLAARLTRKPVEIIPVERLSFSTGVAAVPDAESIPLARIGLGTTSSGRPGGRDHAAIRFSTAFRVVGTKSGKVYAQGGPDERWRLRAVGGGVFEILSPSGQRWGPFKHPVRFEPVLKSSATFILEGTPTGSNTAGLDDHEYRGTLWVAPRSKSLSFINAVNVEEYLFGVVPAEVPATWPEEVLKVQAVIARNQTLLRKSAYHPHRRYHYDLCDGQHCQVYKGVKVEGPRVREAVLSTRAQVVKIGDLLANTVYHSTCGGFTQTAAAVWGWNPVRYLQGVADAPPHPGEPPDSPWRLLVWIKGDPPAHCNDPAIASNSEFRWLRTIAHKDLEDRLNRRFKIGHLRQLLPVKRSRSGHVNELWIIGTRRTLKLKRESRIRHHLGSLRSTLIFIETRRDPAGHPMEYWIHGGGWGHAVGLCQTGAAGQAATHHRNYKEICGFYYPGTEIANLGY